MGIKSLLPGRLGFGPAPLGNMFRAVPHEEAAATVEAAWNAAQVRDAMVDTVTYCVRFTPAVGGPLLLH